MKKKIPSKLQIWIDACKRYHLSHAQIQMARELGLNPKKFGKLANQKQEAWKLPLPQFIEELYFKRFGRRGPESVVSLEERAAEIEHKKEAKRQKKRSESQTQRVASPEEPSEGPPSGKDSLYFKLQGPNDRE